MQNFTFRNPVKVIFGKGAAAKLGPEAAAAGKKALLVYGSGSIKKNGAYDAVTASLTSNGVSVAEHPGVRPNPVLSHVREGIKKARAANCDLVIAAGGGSTIDTAKAIAAGVRFGGDVWDLFSGKAAVADALPIFTVLTLPATGSEMNQGCVITNEDTRQKFSALSPKLFPKASIMDPEFTFTLPRAQSAHGAVDALAHLCEGYFTTEDEDAGITDELVHAVARSVIAATERIFADPRDYGARASMMWSATLALNGLQSLGYGGMSFPNHAIEHSLSALYDVPHGSGLAVIMPAWFKYDLEKKGPGRLEKFGRAVFGVATAEGTITAFEEWFRKIGEPVRLSALGVKEGEIPRIASNALQLIALWGMDYDRAAVEDVLKRAV